MRKDTQPQWTHPQTQPGLLRVPTVDGGQERVRRGLHLKHTPPEEALVVQREEGRGRRRAGGSRQTDLEVGEKQKGIRHDEVKQSEQV